MNNPLKILFKFPTRGRPEYFIKTMENIYSNIAYGDDYLIWVTADSDDASMNNENIRSKYPYDFPNSIVSFGRSTSKVDAINRDMGLASQRFDWDILIVVSDDMEFTFYGFDKIIRDQFSDGDLDKLIHLPDSDAKDALATMYIAGRTFYDRFGFIYNPCYHSLFCDNEIQEIAKQLGCYRYVDIPGIIFHHNPAYGHREKDQMFIEQQEIGWDKDHKTFLERQSKNFYLNI